MLRNVFITALFFYTALATAASSFYCPQNHAYINAGMTQDQVISACGQPTSRQDTNDPVMQQVPVTVLVYSTLNQGPVDFYPGIEPLYEMWSLPSGSQGINLQVSLVNNQISEITLNQKQTNGVSACQGGTFQIGDDIHAVFAACGSPDMVNNTYVNKPVPKSENPEVWHYELPYQPSVTLTFVNGILQSIF